MKYKFFTVSVWNPEPGETALNQFLASHRIISVEKVWLPSEQNPCWAFVITFEDSPPAAASGKRAPVDYKDVLNEEDFQRFAQLRELRNRISKDEGVPAYTVFTNEQLAEMVTRQVKTLSAMKEIPGIGKSRLAHYSEIFLEKLQELL